MEERVVLEETVEVKVSDFVLAVVVEVLEDSDVVLAVAVDVSVVVDTVKLELSVVVKEVDDWVVLELSVQLVVDDSVDVVKSSQYWHHL
jgi:hypothetical protein